MYGHLNALAQPQDGLDVDFLVPGVRGGVLAAPQHRGRLLRGPVQPEVGHELVRDFVPKALVSADDEKLETEAIAVRRHDSLFGHRAHRRPCLRARPESLAATRIPQQEHRTPEVQVRQDVLQRQVELGLVLSSVHTFSAVIEKFLWYGYPVEPQILDAGVIAQNLLQLPQFDAVRVDVVVAAPTMANHTFASSGLAADDVLIRDVKVLQHACIPQRLMSGKGLITRQAHEVIAGYEPEIHALTLLRVDTEVAS